jgi:cytochrome oxidase Cu insertion factor (SCO1/SenC/PrrC family)
MLKFYDDVIKDKIVLISFIYTNCPDTARSRRRG